MSERDDLLRDAREALEEYAVSRDERGGYCCQCSEAWPSTEGERHANDCLLTTLSRHIAGAGEGWRLVPVEPTEAMISAGWIDKEDVNPDDIYRAMIDAAPSAPPQPLCFTRDGPNVRPQPDPRPAHGAAAGGA